MKLISVAWLLVILLLSCTTADRDRCAKVVERYRLCPSHDLMEIVKCLQRQSEVDSVTFHLRGGIVTGPVGLRIYMRDGSAVHLLTSSYKLPPQSEFREAVLKGKPPFNNLKVAQVTVYTACDSMRIAVDTIVEQFIDWP